MLKLNGLSQLLTEHHKLKITERTVVLTKSLKFKEKTGRIEHEQKRKTPLKPRNHGAR
jgi:hypothetical protein